MADKILQATSFPLDMNPKDGMFVYFCDEGKWSRRKILSDGTFDFPKKSGKPPRGYFTIVDKRAPSPQGVRP